MDMLIRKNSCFVITEGFKLCCEYDCFPVIPMPIPQVMHLQYIILSCEI